MLNRHEVDQIVDGAAEAVLPRLRWSRAFSQPTTYSDGRDPWQVTIVLDDNWQAEVNGDRTVDTIVSVMQSLQNSDKGRFLIIEFGTEDDLKLADAAQS
jgi:hypothetical protein